MSVAESPSDHRVVIIGGGFAGLTAASRLAASGATITLIDRSNVHVFQPLLYQVASGGLSPANISMPLRAALAKHRNVHCMHAEVTEIDPDERIVHTTAEPVGYDELIVATGAEESYFGNDHWREHTIGLKSLSDAVAMRSLILSRFEEAEWCREAAQQRRLMTVVVIGGGPTGVELAGAVAELAHNTMRRDFRHIDPRTTRVVLLEMLPELLPPFPDQLSARARKDLEELGVEVRTNCKVEDIRADGVPISCKRGNKTEDGEDEIQEDHIDTCTVLWAAGVKANALGQQLCERCGVEPAKGGAVPVGPDCTLQGRSDIFVIGDQAALIDSKERKVPPLAPAAIQQGRYVAKLLRRRWQGKTTDPFTYFDKGMMATIGRNRAVAESFGLKFGGRLAWFAWLFVHLMYLVGYDNRLLVLGQWTWNYFNRGRNARLIIGRSQGRPVHEAHPPAYERAGEESEPEPSQQAPREHQPD